MNNGMDLAIDERVTHSQTLYVVTKTPPSAFVWTAIIGAAGVGDSVDFFGVPMKPGDCLVLAVVSKAGEKS